MIEINKYKIKIKVKVNFFHLYCIISYKFDNWFLTCYSAQWEINFFLDLLFYFLSISLFFFLLACFLLSLTALLFFSDLLSSRFLLILLTILISLIALKIFCWKILFIYLWLSHKIFLGTISLNQWFAYVAIEVPLKVYHLRFPHCLILLHCTYHSSVLLNFYFFHFS